MQLRVCSNSVPPHEHTLSFCGDGLSELREELERTRVRVTEVKGALAGDPNLWATKLSAMGEPIS